MIYTELSEISKKAINYTEIENLENIAHINNLTIIRYKG